MEKFFVIRGTIALVLSAGFAVTHSALPQTEPVIKGVVVTKEGRPLAGVTVGGSVWKRCCPYQAEKMITNEKGEFRLQHSSAVVHFWKAGQQPLTFVVVPKVSDLRIVLYPSTDDLVVPVCASPTPGRNHIGWGAFGPYFAVPKTGVEVRGGKTDVDYVRYVIKRTGGNSYLEFWLGHSAMSTEPRDQLFVESSNFAQRDLKSSEGQVIGRDSWGQLHNGAKWRQMAITGSGERFTRKPVLRRRAFSMKS